jgi:hypothetical protein
VPEHLALVHFVCNHGMIAMQKENETSVRKDVEQTDSTLERTDRRPGPSADLTPHPFSPPQAGLAL